MSEENRAIIRRLVDEVWNQGKLSVIDEIHTPNYVGHAPPEHMRGPEGYKELVAKYRAALPDIRWSIEDMITQGDRVVFRWSTRWTHKGDLGGIAPTGKKGTAMGISICRITDGRIAEEWATWDALGFLQQIGVIPELVGQAKEKAAG
ncbi:MAG: ester cyclase [bacterium]|nr:ester cyclase [bacterium]